MGIGGITLGGGIGLLSRKYGLTIDSLLAAEVVTADAEVRVVDADRYSDLFWAIRGGGGNFGVATRFKYQTRSIAQVVGGMLVLPASPETVAGFLELSDGAEELSTIANVIAAPPMPFLPDDVVGKTVILGLMAWCGQRDDGVAVVDRFRSLATPLADFVGEIPYSQTFPPEDEGYRPNAVGRTGFMDNVDAATVAAVFNAIQDFDAPMRAVQIRTMGRAISRVDRAATAFAHRDRKWMVNVGSFYETETDRLPRQAWVEHHHAALTGGDMAGYPGFLGDEGADRIRAAYPGDTWDRLRGRKGQVRPGQPLPRKSKLPPH